MKRQSEAPAGAPNKIGGLSPALAMLEKRLGPTEKQEGIDVPKKESKSNGLALPTPVKKKVSGALDLYGDLPPPTNDVKKTLTHAPPQKKAKPDRTKVIFLDVDGVLRPAAAGGSSTVFVDGEMVPHVGGGSDFLPGAIRALKWIVYETGARIVLSTEWWRYEPLFEAVNKCLLENGMTPCREGSDTTPMHPPLNMGQDQDGLMRDFAIRRVHEITEWLGKNQEVTHWVAIDDVDLRMCKDPPKRTENLVDCFILTNDQIGFTMSNAQRARQILMPQGPKSE
jgi:hypothetical protein